MPKITSSERQLVYPLKNALAIDSAISESLPVVLNPDGLFPSDSDERIHIVLHVSLNEYVQIADAVDVGRDIAFGISSVELWEIWSRAVVDDLCNAILSCINTNQDIQDAISFYGAQSNIQSDSTEDVSILASGVIDNPVGCDDDIIYGMTVQIVEFMDRTIKDLFEAIEQVNAASVNLGYVISLIPVIESLPIDEAFEFTNKLVNTIETAYLAASTQALKTQIACDLFCIAKNNNCTLTMQDIRDYYEEQSGIVVTYTDVLTFIIDFTNGTFVGNVAYYGMNLLMSQIMAFAGSFVGLFFDDFLRIISTMVNDPDPDWSINCDPCVASWTHTFDFTVGDGGFVPTNLGWTPTSLAVYSAGVGWSFVDAVPNDTTYRRVTFIRKTFVDTDITEISMTFDLTVGSIAGSQTGTTAQNITMWQNSVLQASKPVTYGQLVSGQGKVDTLTASHNLDEFRLGISSSITLNNTFNGSCILKSCTVKGTGVNPFI